MVEEGKTGNWWSRRGKFSKVAIIIVGLVVVVSLLSDGDDNETAQTTTTESTLAEETETTEPATNETEMTEEPTTATSETTTTTERETTTTAAPTTTTVPAPNVYTGSGDSVVDIEKPDDLAVIYVKGNSAGRHFAVTGHGPGGGQTELFVNTTDPYEGVRALDFRQGEQTTRLEINASGSWKVEIRSAFSVRTIEVGEIIKGEGDDVFLIEGTPDTAIVEANAAKGHFAVTAYGTTVDLLVNTVDAYEGEVIVPPDTRVFAVQATRPWAISVR